MLATALDCVYLSGWNFFQYFPKHRSAFVGIGQAVFRFLASSGRQPLPSDCERLFTLALLASRVFAGLASANKLPNDPHLHLTFAGPVARILLDQEWSDISS
jgi:hypothetical protein